MRSIRIKITAITIAAILTSVMSVICLCFFTIWAENERSSAVEMNLLNGNIQKSLDEYFLSIEQSVEMAANIAVESLDSVVLVEGGVAGTNANNVPRTPEQKAEIDAYMTEHCEKVLDAFSSVASHTRGVVTYYYCINPEVSESEHGFFYSKVGKSGFYEREPLDARELDPEDIEHTTWYYTPIRRGRPSWVGPYRAAFLGETWTLSYLVPIYKAGALIGVLGMDIFSDTLVSQVEPVRIYETGFACVLDTEGRIIYHPEMEYGAYPDYSALELEEDLFASDNSGDSLISYTINGVRKQMAFSTLVTGMKLLITAPESEINASWRQLTRMILMTTVLIIAVFAGIILLAMRIIIRPLQELTSASQRLAAGEYDVQLDYQGHDEVGILTKAFVRMRDHLKHYINDLNRRIFSDTLTGLPNMSHFLTLAEAGRLAMKEEGRASAVLFFNLVGMKYYNRQYGFAEGDRLICEVADILAEHFGRENCGRFGQDHFAVFTAEDGLEDRLREALDDCAKANGGRTLTVRVGIYRDSLEDVDANVACDRAKYVCDMSRGIYRSGFDYYSEGMLRDAESMHYIINNIDRALRERWITVYYQPVVRAANGRVCNEEALSRWIDPVRGFLSPGVFIPVLEGARLIYKLDLYVLDRVLEKIRDQQQAGLYIVPHSINLSRTDFDDCNIIEEIRRRTDKAGVPRDKIVIEVTESTVGSDFEFIREQVRRLRELGFPVWMDDFGSGYSSLDVLQDIRFDLIKFDMRFMQRFEDGDSSRIILTELIKMAISLGIDTIAEGVETEEQVNFLKEVGCTKLQGFYFCRPIPAEEIFERYRKGIQIGFENPEETEYYSAIGRINLYDLSAVTNDRNTQLSNFFDTLPMAVMESGEDSVRIIRCNRSYRDFMRRAFGRMEDSPEVEFKEFSQGGPGDPFARAIRQCTEEGSLAFIDEKLPDGSRIHAMLRHVAVNPVTGIIACVVVVLDFGNPQKQENNT